MQKRGGYAFEKQPVADSVQAGTRSLFELSHLQHDRPWSTIFAQGREPKSCLGNEVCRQHAYSCSSESEAQEGDQLV
jgi:hypothetical protein